MSMKPRSTNASTPTARANQAEQELAQALALLAQERQRSQVLIAKLQEHNIPLDFLAPLEPPTPLEALALPTLAHAVSPTTPTTAAASAMPTAGTPNSIQSIYTDGACSGNPGPGGWGTVIYFADGSVRELGGYAPSTTNNRMEMQAAIAALDFILASGQTLPIVLLTDSEYVKNGITKWIKGWKQKGWKTSTGKPVLNQDLWEALDEQHLQVNRQLTRPLEWQYVRGHVGNVGNERADAIARAFSQGRTPNLA